METKLIIIHFLNKFNFSRNKVPLRVHVKFLYEPFEENLVVLSKGGLQLQGWLFICIQFMDFFLVSKKY